MTEKYQTTSHAPEALERLVESYLALGVPDEARKTAAVLGKNYPESYWYRQSLRLLIKERNHTGGQTVDAASPARGAYPQKAGAASRAPSKPKSAPSSASYPDRPGGSE